ncbi:hypothetical protein VSH64_24375 [Amycolatopsis rhabdoformis]|uniref:Uncharacterized protein n=1 Tax=Amycolatopsis rhabdoformis TaxID=1448059 RepID=A0ABZ1HXC6_9PSEU|nr:hypothetical protein [Amycolatopsis rhabdoformis]WSE26020.1 hypothetical protein VSH64_24375 [Amycolatopsis rhabdoformis]
MNVVTIVEKFGADEWLEREWELPPDVVEQLRGQVDLTPEGWIRHVWPITAEIAAVVQPWVDERIDLASASWYVSSVQDTA